MVAFVIKAGGTYFRKNHHFGMISMGMQVGHHDVPFYFTLHNEILPPFVFLHLRLRPRKKLPLVTPLFIPLLML
jgi:hypothetical protein